VGVLRRVECICEGLCVFGRLFSSIVSVRSRKLTEDVKPLDVQLSCEYEFVSCRNSLSSSSELVHIPSLSSIKRQRNGSKGNHFGRMYLHSIYAQYSVA
jgi:hypothetical protein